MYRETQTPYIDEAILERLAGIGKCNGLSLSALLNEILQSYLETNDPNFRSGEDRRRFNRKKVIIPAIIYEKNESESIGRYSSSTILDLSLGGVRLSFPLGSESKTQIIKSGTEFEVIFSLNGSKEPVVFKCNAARLEKKDYGVQVGAAFNASNVQSHDYLQKHLV